MISVAENERMRLVFCVWWAANPNSIRCRNEPMNLREPSWWTNEPLSFHWRWKKCRYELVITDGIVCELARWFALSAESEGKTHFARYKCCPGSSYFLSFRTSCFIHGCFIGFDLLWLISAYCLSFDVFFQMVG